MLSETKQKFFLGALARRNFVAPTRPKNFCLTSHSIRNRHISSAFTFTGNQFLTYILKRMKVFYDRYETLLHIFTSDSVRQVLPKFLPLNCGRKITDFKEWSKIRVCCFFWQIKLGKNLFCVGSKKIRSYALILFKKGEGTFNLKDLRFNLRLNVFIANDIKNLGGIGIERKNLGEIGIEKVWSKTFHQNRKRKRHKNTESKRQKANFNFETKS